MSTTYFLFSRLFSVVEKLVECYKDSNMDFVNLPSENGSTALLLAAENNKVDAARLLLQTVSSFVL